MPLWREALTYRNKNVEIAVYWATMSQGYFACWRQQARKYKHGFVLRILWFGFVLRYGQDDKPKSPWYSPAPRQQMEDRHVRYMQSGNPVRIVELDAPSMDDIVRRKLEEKRRTDPYEFYHQRLRSEREPSKAMELGTRIHEEARAHFALDVLRAADRQREAESRSLDGASAVVAGSGVHQDHLPRCGTDSTVAT